MCFKIQKGMDLGSQFKLIFGILITISKKSEQQTLDPVGRSVSL